jgi:phosphatidylglycerol---prolipoprotein diacylglyceryl transferase
MYPYIHVPYATITVQSYVVCLIFAFAVSLLLGYRSAVRLEGLAPRATRTALAIVAAAALAGGHLHFIVANYAAQRGDVWNLVLSPSLHAPGAVLGALCGFLGAARVVPVRRLADALAPGAGVGIAIARLGCFLNGCCFGEVCRYPWGVRFPRQHLSYLLQIDKRLLPPDAAAPLPVHPLQLYFAVTGLLIAALLYRLRRHKRYDGQVGLLFLVLFSATSAVWEPLRADTVDRVYIGPWPQLLWITALMTVVATTLLVIADWRLAGRGDGRRPAAAREIAPGR